jgi:hypothetical protein
MDSYHLEKWVLTLNKKKERKKKPTTPNLYSPSSISTSMLHSRFWMKTSNLHIIFGQ